MKMMSSTVVWILKLVGAIFVVLQLGLLLSNYCGVVAAKHVASVFGGCIEKERHALLELKASLVLYDDTSLLSTWDSKSDGCCAWEGIVCSNQTGHVEMLDLNGDQFGPFRGKINTSLIDLQHLKYLNLSFNRMSNNNFPELFGSLSNLRFLDLKATYSGGRIPNDLARLSHLQYLDLSVNDLKGTIPRQLGNLSHLQYLDLSWNLLVGTIPNQLGSLSNLQQLHLGYNEGLKVHDKNNQVGGEWLSNLTLLTHLDLSALPNLNSSHVWLQMIGKLPKIQELKLSQCDLSDHYLRSYSRSPLNFSTSLAILDLSSNSFSSSKIFEWVFNATTNLIELDLSYNIFKGTITYDFGNVCTLHSLYLDSINLNKDISTILLKLAGCAGYSIQQLSLYGNQITDTFPDLSIFPSLIGIDLSNNLLSGKVPDDARFLPSKLEYLIFRLNSFEGGIPQSFGNLCSLRLIDLSSNKLSEDLSEIIHNLSVGCAMHSLQKLILGSNQIIGTVPDMSRFSSLRNLFLSDNRLHGRILKNSTFPSQLETLYLDSNNLEGAITDSHFDNMSMLKYLNLSCNSLALIFSEDWVPPFQLSTIYLRSCTLGPSFPKWLHSQKHLGLMDISDTRISDVVPVWFWTQATNLRFMNISYNNLTGTIPNLSVRFFEDFQAYLDSNQFEGSIPPFFSKCDIATDVKEQIFRN